MVAIFVVLMILVFLGIDAWMQRRQARRAAVAGGDLRAVVRLPKVRLLKGLFYAPNHLWIRVEPDGRARLGVDDFAPKLLGHVDAIEAVQPGTAVRKGQPLLRLRQGDRVIVLRAPVSGRVLRVNEDLLKNPQLLKDDPYLQGWVLEVEPDDLGRTASKLLVAERAANWLRREGQRLREFLGEELLARPQVGVTMADGGLPAEGVLSHLDEQAWRECQARFFTSYETE